MSHFKGQIEKVKSKHVCFKATPHNLTRRLSQDFCPNSKFEKWRNTVCISHFSNWRSGAKRRLRLAGTIVRRCLKRIFISGMYTDGTMFDGKEDHVWMDKSGFEKYAVGDGVSFGAEVYRYVKPEMENWLTADCVTRQAFKKSKPMSYPAMTRWLCRKLNSLSARPAF